MGTLFQHNTGKALNSADIAGTMQKYITTSNLYWGEFKLDSIREMLFTAEEKERCSIKAGDLLVCEGGDIGRAAIWKYDFQMCIQNHIHRLRSFCRIETQFFYYTFFLYKNIGLIGGKGIGIQGLSTNAIDSLLFPVPPLAEQKRICYQIQTMFDGIKKDGH